MFFVLTWFRCGARLVIYIDGNNNEIPLIMGICEMSASTFCVSVRRTKLGRTISVNSFRFSSMASNATIRCIYNFNSKLKMKMVW